MKKLISISFILFSITISFAQINSIRCLDINLDFVDFGFTEEELANNQLFMIGENHGITLEPYIQNKMLKFLHKHAGVRYVLIEGGYSEALLLNRFLENRDTEPYCSWSIYRTKRCLA